MHLIITPETNINERVAIATLSFILVSGVMIKCINIKLFVGQEVGFEWKD